jgi:hypothetical protein
MTQSVLFIGEDPELIEFSGPGVPPNMDACKVLEGLNALRDRLQALDYAAKGPR